MLCSIIGWGQNILKIILFLLFSATTTVPYSSAPTTPSTKFESIKSWTISTYKCSRQTIYEKLGKSSRTVDSELEAQIESLRETQRKYANILRLSRALTSHFYHVIQTQVNIFFIGIGISLVLFHPPCIHHYILHLLI